MIPSRAACLFGIHPKRRYRALFAVRGDQVVVLAIRAPGEQPVGPGDIPPEGERSPRDRGTALGS